MCIFYGDVFIIFKEKEGFYNVILCKGFSLNS